MNIQQIEDGLAALGFIAGYVIGGDPAEIILWENDEPQPTMKAIEAASVQGAYDREVEAVKQARHAAYIAPDGSDALLAKYQLGEDGITLDMVKARKEEINAQYPYPTPPES